MNIFLHMLIAFVFGMLVGAAMCYKADTNETNWNDADDVDDEGWW